MGASCCSSKDELTFPRNYLTGASVKRSPTDPWMMGLFFTVLGLMAASIVHGVFEGNPKRLTHGYDWQGRVCGEDAAVKDKPYLFFCGGPEREGLYPKFLLSGSTACVASCPADASVRIECLQPAFHNFSSYAGGTIGVGGVKNVETLDMTITQSVIKMDSYPTEVFGGRFCVPSEKKADGTIDPKGKLMKEQIIDGPWGHNYRPLLAAGGFMDAWPLLVGSAILACVLALLYFKVLGDCAGILIFASMLLGSLLAAAAGIYFLWAIFMDLDDKTTYYAQFNPYCSSYVGVEAQAYSIITGMVLVIISGIVALTTYTSMSHIDECIGLIDATCEALIRSPSRYSKEFDTKPLSSLQLYWPLMQAGGFLAGMIALLFVGLPYVASLAKLNGGLIVVNGQEIQGLQKVWQMTPLNVAELTIFIVGTLWIIEFYVQWGHFVVAHCVCNWYFIEGQDVDIPKDKNLAKYEQGGGKHISGIRIAGVDQNYGQRDGVVVDVAGVGKTLMVPIQKKGPGLQRNQYQATSFQKKVAGFPGLGNGIMNANCAAAVHIGTIAVAAFWIALFRPIRVFSQCISGFLSRTSNDPSKGPAADKNPGNANLKGTCALLTAFLDQFFGKYSKHSITELVLSGGSTGGFMPCAQRSFDLLVNCGGSLAYLHGAMAMYEFISSLCITFIVGWTSWIVMEKIDIFNDPTGHWYIEDKIWAEAGCCVMAFAVCVAFMSLWNQTTDVLLYCCAWNRFVSFKGNELCGGNAELKKTVLKPPSDYVPQALRFLIPDYELDCSWEHGIHAHGIAQWSAIVAAMEHGAMNTGAKGAPNYSTAMGSVLATGAKMS